MHKMRFFPGIALLVLLAGGCGLAATSPERGVVVPAEPTMIDFADPATVAGLSTRTLTEGDGSTAVRYVHINYPELADAPALNRALRAQAERQLRDFRRRTGDGDVRPRPELNVDWQLAAASPEAVGVRLRTGEFVGAGWSNSTRTLWFDPHRGEAVGSTGLVAGQDALRRLAALVRDRLKARGAQVEREGVTGDRFDSMAFNHGGDLVVEFDDCEIGPCSLGRLAVAVPAARVAPLLSDLGRRAQESAQAQDDIPTQASAQTKDGIPTHEGAQAQEGVPTQEKAGGHGTSAPGYRMSGPLLQTPTAGPVALGIPAAAVDCARSKCVALTFDDGPGPYTGRLLDLLLKERARATFFVVGRSAAAQPEPLRRMRSEGHLVGNHSWIHRDLTKQPTSKIADSLRRTECAVAAAAGRAPTLVRPPYGAVSRDVRDVARDMGFPLVTWDVDAGDQAEGATSAKIAERVVREAHPGAIILMHDVHRETVDAVPDILKRLRGKGYSFVTVPELYGSAPMQAGRLYGSGSGPIS